MIRRITMLLVCAAVVRASAQSQSPISLSLQQAMARADSTSPTVGIARAGVTSAQANWLRTRAPLLPQLNGSALYTRTLKSEFSAFAGTTTSDSFPAPINCHHFVPNPSLPLDQRIDSLEHALDCTANGSTFDFSQLPFGRPNTWTFALSGSQTLFDRRVAGQLSAASASREQANIELDAQRASAMVTVAQAYFDAQLTQRLADIADSTLAQAERTFQQTRLERQAGNAAEFDQLRASVARDNQTPLLLQRRAQRDQALLRLRQALDLPRDVPLVLTTSLTDTSIALPASVAALSDTSINERAPVRQAEAGIRASDALLRSARAERLPAISLSSTYAKIDFPADVFSFDRFLTDWSVNVQLTVPIFNGGRLHADVLAADAAREQAVWRARQTRQQAELDQSDARTQLETARASYGASTGTVAAAQRAYDIAELRYRNGLSTLTDVGDARLQLAQAQANNAQAARDLQVARLRLALLRDLPLSTGSFINASAPATTAITPAPGTTSAPTGSTFTSTGATRTNTTGSP